MMADAREMPDTEVADLLRMVTPEDAIDMEHLDAAVACAVAQYPDVRKLADEAASGTLGQHAKREQQAYFILKRLVKLRNDWLKANDGYRPMTAMG